MDKTEYIVHCPFCHGSRTITKNGKRKNCSHCKGIGKMTYSKDFLMFQVMDLNRKINVNWEVLNKKRAIPKRFFINTPLDCPVCKGEGRIQENKCSLCSGSGYKPETISKVFRMVFQSFLVMKQRRDTYNKLIEIKAWKRPETVDFSRIKPEKHKVICTRCTHYLNENKNNPCLQCSNYTTQGALFFFKPITEDAAKWYKREGFKWNYNDRTTKERK